MCGLPLQHPAWRIPGTAEPGGLHPWGREESDTTEATQQQQRMLISDIKDAMKKESYRTVPLISRDIKNLEKMLVNQVQR